jgi:uncharacterized protein (UPF0332 family)
MTADQLELLLKAQKSLEAAKVLLKNSYPDFAASRAYYTMFYVAQAFLEGEGLAFSRHSATIAGFGQHFVHTGQVPAEFHRFLIEAQQVRQTGDYSILHRVTSEQAKTQITRAERFMQLAEQMLGPLPHAEKR